jgi:hypothetical protein
MPDPLYLSIWFPSFDETDILPRMLTVLHQFPFSPQNSGVTYLALHPVSWNEPTVLEERFRPGVTPEQAILIASDQLHEDYAYVFEAFWDLWTPDESNQQWSLQPSLVRLIAHGLEFEDRVYQQTGHVQMDLGLDSSFLYEELSLTEQIETRVRANIQKLVEFTNKVERNTGMNGRLLWSESEENLAQKLIARLQKAQ